MSQTVIRPAAVTATDSVQDYRHTQDAAARPEAGAAPRFKKRLPPTTLRYDSSLAPALEWDSNPARDTAAWLLQTIEEAAALPGQVFSQPQELKGSDGVALMRVGGLQDALAALKRMQAPFLDWAGKAERAAVTVPALPLFVHERLSTEAIVQTLGNHRRRAAQDGLPGLFADPEMPLSQQVDAYSHRNRWVNRMILGDSLQVMNSLARFDGLAGQVQCIYMDPPYGVKFGSNFQPFVRKPDVKHNNDADMTREPEMVQAYRDTWALGVHSYLTYLRDRLIAARELLTPSGSIFLQISDDNLHNVRVVMDEIFGAENFVSLINFQTTSGFETKTIATLGDYLLWYARDKPNAWITSLYVEQRPELGEGNAKWLLLSDGSYRGVSAAERRGEVAPPTGSRPYMPDNLQSQNPARAPQPFSFQGRNWSPNQNSHWKASYPSGMQRLAEAGRIHVAKNSLRYRRFHSDFPYQKIGNIWTDTLTGNFNDEKTYVVRTNPKVIERCLLLTTRPGDLVLDPTCGSGTTAHAAERWGRRWITIDTSRVPLALAREKIITATYPWHCLRDEAMGPSGGFVYARKQNRRGEEIGGIVPHLKLENIANNEPPAEEVLVDRPETMDGITRVSGPFVVEAVLPTPHPLEPNAAVASEPDTPADHVARMVEVLRRSPTLALPGGAKVTLKGIRRPGRTLHLSAEATVDYDPAGDTASPANAASSVSTNGLPCQARPVAILFGPADGSVTARAVLEAAKEANAKNYAHLYVIGFGFTAEAQTELEAGEDVLGLPCSRVTVTLDVMMGDLLRTQRSSQIFAITGSPDVQVTRLPDPAEDGAPQWQVRLIGLDTFDPTTMQPCHLKGDNVPMWMLDTGWNGMAFKADQVFFPRTGAWDNLRRALRATHEDSVWEHLRGELSAPFAADVGTSIAVKVLDDRGNELLRVLRLDAE